MLLTRIRLKGLDGFLIESCEITQKVNDHAYAKIAGVLSESSIESSRKLGLTDQRYYLIGYSNHDQGEIVFSGIVYSTNVLIEGELHWLELTLVSDTRQLHSQRKTRTIQDVNTSYQQIFNDISTVNNITVQSETGNQPIGTMIVQYEETDWEFLCRTSSRLNEVVYPIISSTQGGCRIGISAQSSGNHLECSKLGIKHRIGEFKEASASQQLIDSVSYLVTSRQYYPIGSKVKLKEVDQELYVYGLEAKLSHGELVSEYELRTKKGYKTVKTYNTKIAGASLRGKITSIGGDKVKIVVDADQLSNNSLLKEKWFLYSTIYSSPDGTGWYCMPEIGDNVRLYFPSKEEEEAYVISSVHLEVSQTSSHDTSQGLQDSTPPRSDPDTKVISNKYKKEIIFSRDYLKIKSKEGLSVTLDDTQGITIESDRGIYIKAKDIIEITSDDSIYLAAKTTLEAAQNVTNKLIMENNEMVLSGGKLKVQDQA